MIKQLAAIAILASVVSLTAVACGGDAEEEAAAPAAAPAPTGQPTAVVTPTPVPTRPAGAGITNREGNVVEVTLTIVGGGGSTGPKSNTYGAVPFQWFPNEMTFKVGDTVNFTIIPTEDKGSNTVFCSGTWVSASPLNTEIRPTSPTPSIRPGPSASYARSTPTRE